MYVGVSGAALGARALPWERAILLQTCNYLSTACDKSEVARVILIFFSSKQPRYFPRIVVSPYISISVNSAELALTSYARSA